MPLWFPSFAWSAALLSASFSALPLQLLRFMLPALCSLPCPLLFLQLSGLLAAVQPVLSLICHVPHKKAVCDTRHTCATGWLPQFDSTVIWSMEVGIAGCDYLVQWPATCISCRLEQSDCSVMWAGALQRYISSRVLYLCPYQSQTARIWAHTATGSPWPLYAPVS